MSSSDRALTPAPGVRAFPAAQLIAIEGPAAGQKFRLEGSATLGRSPDATIMLEDPEVSRIHARLSRTERGEYLLEDLGSKNGTFVNGVRVERRSVLYGDKIRVGPRATLELSSFDAVEDHLIQRQRFEAIGRLGVGIAHDLNNVLAALEAGAAFLRALSPDRTLGDPEVSECISDLTLAAERASGLTSGILSFARGRRTMRGPVDLSGLAWEVVRMLRHTLDQTIRIEPHIEPNVIVHGNQSELHQVLLNLCLNARDAMPDGGFLRIYTRVDPNPPAELAVPSGRQAARLSVEDTGMGMEPQFVTRIFEPFFTTKREGAGYGLGLATAREIISLHGGLISIDSTPGVGSTFHVVLPRLDRESVRPPPVESKLHAEVEQKATANLATVLLVDDERMVRRSVARLLRQSGFEVLEASDGYEALSLYEKQPCDLVLLDLDMPGLNGEQTQIRLMALDPNVRIIFATGHADPQREASVRSRGALAFLEKPFSLDTLLSLVREAIEGMGDEAFEELTRPK
jgi:signal transduction histidine kinase/ActR/RegA family two-component response regulator